MEKKKEKKEGQGNPALQIVQKAMSQISGCVGPIIPVLIAGGMMKLLVLLVGYTGWMEAGGSTETILKAFGEAPFYFLPLLVAYSAAGHFKVDAGEAIATAAVLLTPGFVGLMSGSEAVTFLGIPVYQTSYFYSVLPVIVIVYVLSVVSAKLKQWMPAAVSGILEPALSILISASLGITVIGPAVAAASSGLGAVIGWMQGHMPVAAWVLFDATLGFQIMIGSHWIFLAMLFEQLGTMGVECGYDFAFATLSMTLSGIALGVLVKAKSQEMKTKTISCFIGTFMTGTSEPGLYGLCMPYPVLMKVCVITGAIAGAYQGLVGVHSYLYSFPAIFSVLMFQSDAEPGNFLKAMIGIGLCLAVSFGLTLLLFRTPEQAKEGD